MHLGGLSYKTKQFFFVLIKLSIVLGAFYFIYLKLTENENLSFSVFFEFLHKNEVFSDKNIIFLLVLTFFNWFFEIVKWKKLVHSVKVISFKIAFEQSLGSLTASLITPNRIGEYGAKAAYYNSKDRKRILLLNLLGNMMQMSATVIFGCIGLYFFTTEYDLELNYIRFSRFLILIIIIAILTTFGLTQNKFKIKGFPIEKIKQFYRQLPSKTLVIGLLLSIIRYLIFSFQFYYLLLMFGIDVQYSNAMIVMTSMYLLSSIIPSIFIFDVIIKGSVAVYLFGLVGVNEFTILSIVTLMWILNFVLPSLFGSYYVLNFNLLKKTD
jgi:hypothetical protein